MKGKERIEFKSLRKLEKMTLNPGLERSVGVFQMSKWGQVTLGRGNSRLEDKACPGWRIAE